MIAPKSKLSYFIAIVLIVVTSIVIGCNDSSSDADDSSRIQPNDTVDTSQMDTASTRPVKTTN